MAAIKGCSVQTNPDRSDLCRIPHFSAQVGWVFTLTLCIISAYRMFTAPV